MNNCVQKKTNILCIIPSIQWIYASMARIKPALLQANIQIIIYDMDQQVIETNHIKLRFSTSEYGLHDYDKVVHVGRSTDYGIDNLISEFKDVKFSMEGLGMAGFQVIYKDDIYDVYDINDHSYQIYIDDGFEYVPKELCEVV